MKQDILVDNPGKSKDANNVIPSENRSSAKRPVPSEYTMDDSFEKSNAVTELNKYYTEKSNDEEEVELRRKGNTDESAVKVDMRQTRQPEYLDREIGEDKMIKTKSKSREMMPVGECRRDLQKRLISAAVTIISTVVIFR